MYAANSGDATLTGYSVGSGSNLSLITNMASSGSSPAIIARAEALGDLAPSVPDYGYAHGFVHAGSAPPATLEPCPEAWWLPSQPAKPQ